MGLGAMSAQGGLEGTGSKGRVKKQLVEFAEVKTMRGSTAAAVGVDLSVPLSWESHASSAKDSTEVNPGGYLSLPLPMVLPTS